MLVIVNVQNPSNKFYHPLFSNYLIKELLPEVPLWTRICVKKFDKTLVTPEKTVATNNSANATVEILYKYAKSDKTILDNSMVSFIEKIV